MLSNFVRQNNRIFLTLFFSYWLFNPAQIFGQGKFESAGNINVIINSIGATESNSKYNFDVPINKNAPLLTGGGFRVEASGTGDTWQIHLSAIADKRNSNLALLKSTLIFTDRNKTKDIQKKIILKKGQTRIFYLKYKNLNYQLTAFYESENKKI